VPLPIPHLIGRVRQTLHLTQQELADRFKSSLRTVQRWEADRSRPQSWEIHRLADAVRPHDAQLASQLDAWAPRPAPPPPPVSEVAPAPAPPPAPAPTPAPVLVDAIVCAAAEAMALAPQAVRPALLAAFGRARDVGMTAEAVVAVLAPPPPPPPAAPEAAGKGKGAKRGT